MATVELDGLWVHDADDLADHVRLTCVRALAPVDEIAGEVRTYAGGRRLARRRPGRAVRYEVTVRLIDRYGMAWLRAHAGQVVMARDYAGGQVWGIFWRVPVTEVESPVTPIVDVTLTIESVSRDASV